MSYFMEMKDNRFFVNTENAGRVIKKLKDNAYDVKLDDEGNIIGIDFVGNNLCEDLDMFNCIAPYVKPGSMIEMLGEDGTRWRWLFDGKTCKEIIAQITWPEGDGRR